MESMISKEDKLKEIKSCINRKDSLYYIPAEDARNFERISRAEGKGTIPIMTYGGYIIYLKAEDSTLPNIPLSKFNFTSGTFEKKWGPNHKTIVLTPNHSSIRKVEIEIQGMDIHTMRLLPDKTGDVIEDTARIKITRHYRFAEGDRENKRDSSEASPGETQARKNSGDAYRLGSTHIHSDNGGNTMAKSSRGGRMTQAKRRAAKSPGGRGKISSRPAGKKIMRT